MSPEEVLYTTELEDMCEQDPSTWENLASQRWQEYSQSFNDTVDSTTGEILCIDGTKQVLNCEIINLFMINYLILIKFRVRRLQKYGASQLMA